MQSLSRVLVINGPNLNLLGTRRPEIYGPTTLVELETACRSWGSASGVAVDAFQSNHEGAIIDRIHQARDDADAIVINPGAFTHYSYAILDALEAIELPAVEVHISDITSREAWRSHSVISPACLATIYGRGIGGYRDALRHLIFRTEHPARTFAYGSHPDQVGDLRTPAGPGPHPVATLLHGGFWRGPWGRDLMDGLAVDLTKRGIATWNIEYRRSRGGWHDAFSDVATAVDHLAGLSADSQLDLDRVAVAGHSAGGQLALWAAGRTRLPADSPWASPLIQTRLAVALAGVVDLLLASEEHLGDDAVVQFFGSPPEAGASPAELLPLGAVQLVAHGTADDRVPVEHSRAYVERARASGDSVEYLQFEGVDHFALIDETSNAWDSIATTAVKRLAEG